MKCLSMSQATWFLFLGAPFYTMLFTIPLRAGFIVDDFDDAVEATTYEMNHIEVVTEHVEGLVVLRNF